MSHDVIRQFSQGMQNQNGGGFQAPMGGPSGVPQQSIPPWLQSLNASQSAGATGNMAPGSGIQNWQPTASVPGSTSGMTADPTSVAAYAPKPPPGMFIDPRVQGGAAAFGTKRPPGPGEVGFNPQSMFWAGYYGGPVGEGGGYTTDASGKETALPSPPDVNPNAFGNMFGNQGSPGPNPVSGAPTNPMGVADSNTFRGGTGGVQSPGMNNFGMGAGSMGQGSFGGQSAGRNK